MKPIEQQLQRDLVDDKYPGPTDWKVSTVSSGDMRKEIEKVEDLHDEQKELLLSVLDDIPYSTYSLIEESIKELKDIAIEAIKQKYNDNR